MAKKNEEVRTNLQCYPNAIVLTIGKPSEKITLKEIIDALTTHNEKLVEDYKKHFPLE